MSQVIKMNPELMILIGQGIKTATTRRGIKDYQMGDVILREEKSGAALTATIINIKYIAFKFLSDDLAKKEGYQTAAQLKEALIKIYGPLHPTETMTVIVFKLKT